MRVLALTTVLLAGATALAAQPVTEAAVPTVTVQGKAEVSVGPDQAMVVVGVEFEAESAATAQQRANTAAGAILRAMRTQGVADEDVQTSALQLSVVRRRAEVSGRTSGTETVGYRARNTVRVRVRDLARVGTVIDAALKAGANRLDGVTFTLADDQEARAQALRLAVLDAAAKANTIARALGLRLAGVQEASEGSVGIRPVMLESTMMRAQATMPTPVSPGEVSVSANVTVRYALAR